MTNSIKRKLLRHADFSENRLIIIDKKNDRILSLELTQEEADEYFNELETSHTTIIEKKDIKNTWQKNDNTVIYKRIQKRPRGEAIRQR